MDDQRKLVVANWKMNGSLSSNEQLLKALRFSSSFSNEQVIVCPPSPYLFQVSQIRKSGDVRFSVGAQDVSAYSHGAYTGDVSASMLQDFEVSHVIVGHSERRALQHETSTLVAAKFDRCLEIGLTPIVCIGETLDQRESDETNSILRAQLIPVLEMANRYTDASFLIAYEPVWAIGTGRTALPDQVAEVHAFIRETLVGFSRTKVLYGGSVKPENAVVLASIDGVDGFLVGGASLQAGAFSEIVDITLSL
jgi:triosephosphate isomerase